MEHWWSEVWKDTNAIVEHVKTGPIYYSENKSIEEVYKEFYGRIDRVNRNISG